MAGPHTTEPVGEVADASALVPEQLGFMCGIEVHQQLATGKLHSRQPGLLYDITIDTVPSDWKRFERSFALLVAKVVQSTLLHGLNLAETDPSSMFKAPTLD